MAKIKNPVTIVQSGGGGDTSKFTSLVDGSITAVTADDLAGKTTIRRNAFFSCASLVSVVIPNSVTYIAGNAFADCTSLASVTLSTALTSISGSTFARCSALTSIILPNGVTNIESQAFEDCISLISIDIPNSVTTIGTYAFADGHMMTNVTIGTGITSIQTGAFINCYSLTGVTIKATTPPVISNTNVFDNTNNCTIYVPAESVEAYQQATNWNALASRIQAISTT